MGARHGVQAHGPVDADLGDHEIGRRAAGREVEVRGVRTRDTTGPHGHIPSAIASVPVTFSTTVPQLLDAVDDAYEHGILIVAGAGNKARDAVTYPALGRHILAIGATTEYGLSRQVLQLRRRPRSRGAGRRR